ncbi:MAG: cytochrome c [Verrucomicrobiota bacterium]
MNPFSRWIIGLVASCVLASLTHAADSERKVTTDPIAQAIEIPGVHNAFRATERIYSGSQPEGDEAFAALAKLGVKTIVSVDGSVPDVETARKYGLRYVHLPYGYDGIPTNRVAELAKLTAELSEPFFVHCHHGLHRGPAAVAVMCEASAGWTTNQAVEWMHVAGTALEYPGLYRAASEFKMPAPAQLAAVKGFPEITKPSTLVEAMVAVDEHFSWLKQSQKVGWKAPPGHADISPAHEATMLWEQLKEVARTKNTAERPEDYRTKLDDAEKSAEALHQLLKDGKNAGAMDAAFKTAGQSCAACHKQYRNE